MRFARHPLVHLLPAFFFIVIILSFHDLQQEPYASTLLPIAFLFIIVAVILYRDAKARLIYSHYHHDMDADTERIYFSQRFSPIEKLMIMEQRTGCGTVLVAWGYVITALLLVGIWLFAKYSHK